MSKHTHKHKSRHSSHKSKHSHKSSRGHKHCHKNSSSNSHEHEHEHKQCEHHGPDECCDKCGCNKNCKVEQVPSYLTTSLQVPNTASYVDNGGLILKVHPKVSYDGSYVYTVYESYPNAGAIVAEVFSNTLGVLSSVVQLQADSFNVDGNINSGSASSDFSLFSVIDDDGTNNIRVSVYDTSLILLYSTTFTDYYPSSQSGKGGIFTHDNKYLFVSYLTDTNVGIVKVLSVTANLSVITTYQLPNFPTEPKLIRLHNHDYIVIGFGTVTTFTDPIISPPFGFNILEFHRNTPSLMLIVTSPLLPSFPNIDITKTSDNDNARIVISMKDNNANVYGVNYPSIPNILPLPSSGATDTNDLQIFDYNAETLHFHKVLSMNIEGGGTAWWVPESHGKVLTIMQSVSAVLDGTTFQTSVGNNTISWLVIDSLEHKNRKTRVVGQIHLSGPADYLSFSRNTKWFAVGCTMVTPDGSATYPNFGLQTTNGYIQPTGYNNLLYYNVSYPCVHKKH